VRMLTVLVSGPAEYADQLAVEMEHRFFDTGQLSAHSAKGLESHFKISVNHARFMTITDLNAMLHLQLKHYGFLPLWELLDAAMTPPENTLEVDTPGGLKFQWRDGAVHSFFESFDWWAQYGSGADKPASDQQLQESYADWTREYRRYLTMLVAHGIRVCQPTVTRCASSLTHPFTVVGCSHATTFRQKPGSGTMTDRRHRKMANMFCGLKREQMRTTGNNGSAMTAIMNFVS